MGFTRYRLARRLVEEGRAERPRRSGAEGHARGAVRPAAVHRPRPARGADVAGTAAAHRPQAPTAGATGQPRQSSLRRRALRQRPHLRPRHRPARPQPDVPTPDDEGTDHREGRRAEAVARPLRPPAQHTVMNIDDKLAAILAAVQTDPGNRGLARDPHDNLLTATAGDFQAACREVAGNRDVVAITTGFFIPSATPPAFETDGPLGVVFLQRALLGCHVLPLPYIAEPAVSGAINSVSDMCELPTVDAE